MENLPATTVQPSAVWGGVDLAKELRQGEVLTALNRYDFSSSRGVVDTFTVPVAVVISQDCDLLGDFESRSAGGPGELDHALLMSGYTVEEVKSITRFGGKEMKPLYQNLNPRWHYLESCPPDCDAARVGFDSMFIDFRSVVAMPAQELYDQCKEQAQRRSMLTMPYREHFQIRAAQFMSRIVLPLPHKY